MRKFTLALRRLDGSSGIASRSCQPAGDVSQGAYWAPTVFLSWPRAPRVPEPIPERQGDVGFATIRRRCPAGRGEALGEDLGANVSVFEFELLDRG